jgi:uncharacterized membrane protein YdjX (TVP38/TMEM64 family)
MLLSIAMSKDKVYKIGLLVISVIISLVIVLNKESIEALAGYGYIGIFLISILGNATVVVPAPVILTALIGGGVFNPILVGIIAAAGATIGELTGFLAGIGGKTFVSKNKWYVKIEKWIHKDGFLTLLVLSAIPNPLFDVAGIIAGVTNYPVKNFLGATFIGKTIKFVTVALLGAYFI